MKISCSQCNRLKAAIDSYIAKADNDLQEALENEGFVESQETIEAIKELEEELATELKRENKYIKNKLEQCSTIEDLKEMWLEIKSKDTFADEVRMLFSEIISPVMSDLATAYLQQSEADMTIESVTLKTIDWIRSWSEELAENMQLSTHDAIEKILVDGINKKSSINEITRRIMESGIRDEYHRARTTAITEVLRAHSYAQQEAMLQDPAATHKQWFHSGAWKIRPRKNHQAIDGQIVEKDKTFILKGADGNEYHPMVPRDTILPVGESINCHCILTYISDKSILGMSLEDRKKLQEEAKKKIDADWEEKFNVENRAKAGITGPDNDSNKSGIKHTKRDVEQYKKYQKVLDDIAPDSFDKFLEIKYNINNEWSILKYQYRTVNRYEINGNVPASKILELDNIAWTTKQTGFDYSALTGKNKKRVKQLSNGGNAAVLSFEGVTYFSHSRFEMPGTLEISSYKGSYPAISLKQERQFEVLDLGDGIPRETDTEAKFFEFVADNITEDTETEITILSEKHICESCEHVMSQFKTKYQNVTVNIVSGKRNYNGSKNGLKTWQHRKRVK